MTFDSNSSIFSCRKGHGNVMARTRPAVLTYGALAGGPALPAARGQATGRAYPRGPGTGARRVFPFHIQAQEVRRAGRAHVGPARTQPPCTCALRPLPPPGSPRATCASRAGPPATPGPGPDPQSAASSDPGQREQSQGGMSLSMGEKVGTPQASQRGGVTLTGLRDRDSSLAPRWGPCASGPRGSPWRSRGHRPSPVEGEVQSPG